MSASDKQSDQKVRLDRRTLLSTSVSAGTIALVPLITSSCSTPAPDTAAVTSLFTPAQESVLTAMIDRLVPADELSPAASECGVIDYINRSLAQWNQSDVTLLTSGLAGLDAAANTSLGQGFAALDAAQQDALLLQMEAGTLTTAQAQAAFSRIHRLTLEGMFSDPYYGGNRNYAGWDLIGYPGAVMASNADMQKMGGRLPLLHTSAYGADHDGH